MASGGCLSFRVAVVLGTRPDAIKLAPVIVALEGLPCCHVTTCSTGQHREMLDQVLDLFNVSCAHDLNVMRANQSLADLTSNLLRGMTALFQSERPDLVLVQGDTTTAMAAGLAAFYLAIPVAHLEAGLRSDNLQAPWPEEMNRRVLSLLSSLHFAPTQRSYDRLLAEGIAAEAVVLTGNTVVDALFEALGRLDRDDTLRRRVDAVFAGLDEGKRVILATSHRRESFGAGLRNICQAIRQIADRGDVQVVYPVHPNTNVSEAVRALLGAHPNVLLTDPLDYFQFLSLLRRCHLVITDSGGVQEEAPSLGKPVLVMRETTERPEGIDAGVARLVGTETPGIVGAVTELLDNPTAYAAMARSVEVYGDGRAAARVAAAVEHWWLGRRATVAVAGA